MKKKILELFFVTFSSSIFSTVAIIIFPKYKLYSSAIGASLGACLAFAFFNLSSLRVDGVDKIRGYKNPFFDRKSDKIFRIVIIIVSIVIFSLVDLRKFYSEKTILIISNSARVSTLIASVMASIMTGYFLSFVFLTLEGRLKYFILLIFIATTSVFSRFDFVYNWYLTDSTGELNSYFPLSLITVWSALCSGWIWIFADGWQRNQRKR